MGAPNEKTPKWISHRQLAAVGLALVSREPLVVQCMI